MAAWDRQEKEPPKAYQHFTIYRDLGPERSLAKVGQILGVAVQSLEPKASQWNWVARCDQWDAHVQVIQQRAYLDEAAKRGQQRAKAYTALLGKSLEALGKIDLSRANLGQVAAAMKAAAEGMRLEEGLATARTTLELQDARFILSRLPAETRREVLQALGAELGAGRDPVATGGVPLGLDGDE